MSEEPVDPLRPPDPFLVDESVLPDPPVPASPAPVADDPDEPEAMWPEPPVVTAAQPGEYPMVLYHRTQPPITVYTLEARAILGSDWFEHPVGTS